jgi:hypothetical protein
MNIRVYKGMEVQLYAFMNLAVVSFTHHSLYPEEGVLGSYYTGGWVGLRAHLDSVEKRKPFCPCSGSNPDSSVVQLVAESPYQLSRTRQLKFSPCCFVTPYLLPLLFKVDEVSETGQYS